MGHMDDDNVERFTVTVRWGNDSTPEVFQHATNVDSADDEVTFDDSQGQHHTFNGVSYHIVEE
jgi:hypothetical protein